jgi:hypothetical protein
MTPIHEFEHTLLRALDVIGVKRFPFNASFDMIEGLVQGGPDVPLWEEGWYESAGWRLVPPPEPEPGSREALVLAANEALLAEAAEIRWIGGGNPAYDEEGRWARPGSPLAVKTQERIEQRRKKRAAEAKARREEREKEERRKRRAAREKQRQAEEEALAAREKQLALQRREQAERVPEKE